MIPGIELFFLGYFTDLFADFNLVLKVFAWLSIVAFIKMHLGNSSLGLALIIGLSFFILFDYWKFFGSVFILFSLLTMGAAGILIDFFFVSQGVAPGSAQSGPVSSGADIAQRQAQMMAARKSLMGKPKMPGG